MVVEHYGVSAPNAPDKGYSPEHQFGLPVFGVFSWQVGRKTSIVDCNTGIFVRGGEEFSEMHPARKIGHSGLLVTPAHDLLDELAGGRRAVLSEIFAADTRPASAVAQLCAHRLVCAGDTMTPLEVEECGIEFATALLRSDQPPINGSKRIIDRTKELLHELDCEPLSLAEVAAVVGVTPIYLTQSFKRAEGIPLYKYQSRLRMSRALAEVPFVESLVALAFELGYSSHSHFAAAFRSQFGFTPSDYRSRMRAAA
ncbi:MAG: AraC family transcriptional regulator [Methylococcales bacterium]